MAVEDSVPLLGETKNLPISSLRLDSENPRIPNEHGLTSQRDLAIQLAIGFDPFTVAESIARYGYFASEPMIAIPNDAEQGTYVVVEGNRRLTALLALTDSSLRSDLPAPEDWDAIAEGSAVSSATLIPVVIASDRKAVTPILGFRHISGVMTWKPFAKARYVAKLVDDDAVSFKEVAQMTGLDLTEVRGLYREQAIAQQIRSLGVDTGDVEGAFSLLTVAMSHTKLRVHVGAPISGQVKAGVEPIPSDKTPELKEVLGWIYGDGTQPAIIAESREIGRVAKVVGEPAGLKALRDGKSLQMAEQVVKDATDDPRRTAIARLRAARNSLDAAVQLVEHVKDDLEAQKLIEEVDEHVRVLLEAIGDV